MVPYSKMHFQVSLSQDIPPGWISRTIEHSKPLFGQTGGAETLIQVGNFPEYSIQFVESRASGTETLAYIQEQPVYFLMVQLRSTLQASLLDAMPIRMLEWSFNFFYSPQMELNVKMHPGEHSQTFFLIVPEAFMLYFGKENDSIRNFHRRTKDKSPVSLMPQPKICPLSVLHRINDLQANGLSGLDLKFAESILTEVFDSANSLPYKHIHYDEKIINRLYELKAFLQQDPDRHLTRTELMNRFRLNAQQFHKGFSAIYNFTPFAFLKYLRNHNE